MRFVQNECVILVLYEETIEFALSVRCQAVGSMKRGNLTKRDGSVALDGRKEEILDLALGYTCLSSLWVASEDQRPFS